MESAPEPGEPIVEELARMLKELDLGCTRREALRGFARRVPTDEVRELVNSATQAEDKGSPLARTLTIQAQTLRLRRSVSVEEAASGAALMLIGPTALIFLCVIALLLGPVVVRFMVGGVGAS
jgi:tight adherence protein C